MNTKTILLLWAAVAVGTVAVTLLVLTRQTSPVTLSRAAEPESQPQVEQASDATRPAVLEPLPSETRRTPTPQPVKPAVPAEVGTEAPAIVPEPDPLFDDPVFKEQLGRYALSYVGADPAADEVWVSLIYDSSLSEKVREDLMEDLNENGFSDGDGRRATVDDLPLIENRLALLEEHMPVADEFMLTHLAEAYKDLANMWFRLTSR